MSRIFNFNPGPTGLPASVLKKAQEMVWELPGAGAGVMEISHRSPEFMAIFADIKARARRLLGLPDDMKILFCQGGARMQFGMIPMNFLHTAAAYVNTGNWSARAIDEARLFGETRVVASSEAATFNYIPKWQDSWLKGDESYLHLTSNNTIYGTQWHQWPATGNVPLVVDMSSDIASYEVDFNQFAMVYAGAQKNLGAAGVTLVFIKEEFAAKAKDEHLISMLRYRTFIEKDSLYNTPPVWNIYIVGLMLEWIEEMGGVAGIEAKNKAKAKRLYDMIDNNPDFFTGTAEKDSRSLMNITFTLPTPELDMQLVEEGKKEGFLGLKGHRINGGIRVSNYNAVTEEAIEQLVAFCTSFAKKHGA